MMRWPFRKSSVRADSSGSKIKPPILLHADAVACAQLIALYVMCHRKRRTRRRTHYNRAPWVRRFSRCKRWKGTWCITLSDTLLNPWGKAIRYRDNRGPGKSCGSSSDQDGWDEWDGWGKRRDGVRVRSCLVSFSTPRRRSDLDARP